MERYGGCQPICHRFTEALDYLFCAECVQGCDGRVRGICVPANETLHNCVGIVDSALSCMLCCAGQQEPHSSHR